MKLRLVCLLLAILTASLVAQGVDTAWVRIYSSTPPNSNLGSDLCVDHAGNVIVTSGAATLKYSPVGELLWVGEYGGLFVGVDGQDNVIVGAYVGYPNPVCRMVKYLPSGDTAWLRTYDGPAHNQAFLFDMEVDDAGNSYFTGETIAEGSADVYATVKYSPNGDTAWARLYDGAPNNWDRAYSIAIDKQGNVYVTGYSRPDIFQAATIKYYPNGDTAWVRRYGTTYTEGHYVAADDSGNVFVSVRNASVRQLKYDWDGNLVWTAPLGGGKVSFDGTGNAYTTCAYGSGVGIVKFLPSGDTAWTSEYRSPLDPADRITDLIADASGNVFVTGYGYKQFAEDDSATDYMTIKYNTSGNPDWIKRFDGAAQREDRSAAIAIDASGCAYVTGGSVSSFGAYDIATIKYQPVSSICGDANGSGAVDISDAVYLLTYIFGGGPAPLPLSGGNVNCDGSIDISDVVYMILYIFSGGLPPCTGC